MSKSYIKCPNCGTENVNNDYCSNCGTILNIVLQRKLERDKKNQLKKEEEEAEGPSRLEVFLKKGLEHPNLIIRMFFKIGYGFWFFFAVIIGGFIAAVVGAAAG
ncbi:hypothetical protein [Flavobacterium sp. SM2513]|uniref:hypothetical protein n=1 Tax=Flavobacterium sp. SM2513 TaxID=3424766 RepID=UPI003D7F929A